MTEDAAMKRLTAESCIIPLSLGMIALVDAEDFDRVSAFKWYATRKGYAVRGIRIDGVKATMRMHRFILGIAHGDRVVVDHKNGNGFDNRRENLRLATPSQNCQNRIRTTNAKRGGYKGVWLSTVNGKWRANIRVPNPSGVGTGRNRTIGHYNSEVEAARAYDAQAILLFGEFAALNFPHDHARTGSDSK